jgi:hypothetical protein
VLAPCDLLALAEDPRSVNLQEREGLIADTFDTSATFQVMKTLTRISETQACAGHGLFPEC